MRSIEVRGGSLNVYDCGAGPAVLFVHGYPLNHTMWRDQLASLSRGNRLIAPDLRGFGHSLVTDGTVTMEEMADDLALLLDRLGIMQPVCLCGLSMGGYIAFQFLRKYRHRVRSLVLCDTRSAADTPEAAAARREVADKVLVEGAAPIAEAMLPKLLAAQTIEQRPQLAATVREMITSTPPQGIAAAQRGMALRPDSTELLGTLEMRTMVIVGEHDAISPPDEMRKISTAIPGSEMVVIPGAGHMAPMENAPAVNAALSRFLADELHAR